MKKTQPSKKKPQNKNRKAETAAVSSKYQDSTEAGRSPVEKRDKDAHTHGKLTEKRRTDREARPIWDIADDKYLSKRSLRQPESRLGDLDQIWQETNLGQDFATLAEAPLSTARFEFKSEKNWTLDTSDYDEFFSIDLNNLAAIVNCIPFNKLIEVDDKYFTKDELTHMHNKAEQAKKVYYETLESLREEKLKSQSVAGGSSVSEEEANNSNTNSSLQSVRLTDDSNQDIEALEEDLNLLLSLKEPIRPQPIVVNVAPPTKSSLNESKAKSVPAATKSIDLEKWLDLVLDD